LSDAPINSQPSWLARLCHTENNELPALAWSFLYFFFLLCGYYILRPVRETMAIEGGVKNLPLMMSATFLATLALTPMFGFLTARFSRSQFLPAVYIFFALNLVGFYAAFAAGIEPVWTARAFFVWLSVFNLFVVSVFWSFMADIFTSAQGKRLFGVIAAGGSTGALAGPLMASMLVGTLGVANLMLLSALLLLACVLCISQVSRWARQYAQTAQQSAEQAMGGGFLSGIKETFSSPYLLAICGYLFALTLTSTFLYLEQARLVSEQIPSSEERTRFYAHMDLAVNLLTLFAQLFVTGRLIEKLGLAAALLLMPTVSVVGFMFIGSGPTLMIFVFFIVARRLVEYAVSRPAREVLFTVVKREEKYKAKNFIDTAILRGGDASSGWLLTGIKSLGANTAQLAWLLIPVALAWSWGAWYLARKQTALQSQQAP
jgi:ATP:ADP antiporter, AAA family